MTPKNEDARSRKEEESRWIDFWAIWLPIAVATTGAAIWFFFFVLLG
jgi:hypothetical protein